MFSALYVLNEQNSGKRKMCEITALQSAHIIYCQWKPNRVSSFCQLMILALKIRRTSRIGFQWIIPTISNSTVHCIHWNIEGSLLLCSQKTTRPFLPRYGIFSNGRWRTWPPDMENNCEYVEYIVTDSQQSVALKPGSWA